MSGDTFENGLSVSVESSPRTPSLVSGINRSGSGFYGDGDRDEEERVMLCAFLKKRMQNWCVREILMEEDIEVYDAAIETRHAAEEKEEESISPRVLFPSSQSNRREEVARRLDFYSSGEWSPIPLPTSSSASAAAAASAVESWEDALPIVPPTATEPEATVGECSVCYLSLPKLSNHVFTACGHLFCVKCMLLWWDTSSTCAMCRAEILDANDAAVVVPALESDSDSDSESDSESEQEEGDDVPNFQDFISIALADRRRSDDDNIGGRDVEPPRPIPAIDQYLHTDTGVDWSILEGTNPEHDDEAFQLTRHECVNIRWGRETAAMLWARRRFSETLFSDIDFLGETFHTFIPKTNWLSFSVTDMGPHRMFEFVMCRANVHNRGYETNFFGYISRLIVVEADHPVTTISYDAFVEWENTNEYAFVVNVFSPTTPPYDMYNVDEGTYGTTELMFRFADIRRMYSIQTCERGSA